MDIDRLRKLAEKTKGWTKEDKEWLSPILAELGIEAPTKTSCPSCWRDSAIMAIVKLGDKDTKSVKGFLLKGAAKRGVIWKGKFVSDATLDEAMADWLRETGFPENLWSDED